MAAVRQGAQELGQWDTKSESAAFDVAQMVRLLHEGRKRTRDLAIAQKLEVRRSREAREKRQPLARPAQALRGRYNRRARR